MGRRRPGCGFGEEGDDLGGAGVGHGGVAGGDGVGVALDDFVGGGDEFGEGGEGGVEAIGAEAVEDEDFGGVLEAVGAAAEAAQKSRT